ncbi:MAG: diguanylate cyclase [Firmicutes bacterium HGW-Firmicutes-3]|jgi:diguanylate cyclase (GGDEF)-like protein|nr:MAG: diguanylate cyclase [Firmicutes bacterium HGW-Firmicutes-3]
MFIVKMMGELCRMNNNFGKKTEDHLNKNDEKSKKKEKKPSIKAELAIAKKEIANQKEEKADMQAELDIADKEVDDQKEEKADLEAELVIVNKEVANQKEEKADVEAELATTIKELANQITLRKEALEKIEQIMHYDSLTGFPNRVRLEDKLRHEINIAKRHEKRIGILFLDLDGFKPVRNTLGQFQEGEFIKTVAVRLKNLVQESDIVARLGGDKFIIMIQNPENSEFVRTVANKIITAFRQPFEVNQNEIYVTVSIGISVFPRDGETHEDLIKNAELAMYKAKEKGKNQSVLCTTIMKEIIRENMKLSNGLYRALERDELEVYYQPQISQDTKKIVGLEALLRWNHPGLGVVPPGKFIFLAEQNGLIIPIGKWVLHTVCKQNKAWQEAGLTPIRIAVNLSIIQFQNLEIMSQINEVLEATNLLPKYLELEITESIAMRDTVYIIDVLNTFQKMGIYISIDDFGTEFSSLQYLKLLPINRIKIPMPFIQGINIDKRDEWIIETIIVLARKMGLAVIAEGVETRQQDSFLKKRLCGGIQGYYYYKPMPAKDIEVLLHTNS